MPDYEIRPGESEYGFDETFVLYGPWLPSYRRVMKERGIQSLLMYQSPGAKNGGLGFLTALSFLEALYIRSPTSRLNVSEIGELEGLRLLQVESTRLEGSVDFDRLTKLQVARVTWHKAFEQITRCGSLRYLRVERWPHSSLKPLGDVSGLERLFLQSRKLVSVRGLAALMNLKHLELHECTQLVSLTGLDDARSLEILSLSSTKKFRDLKPLAPLLALKALELESCGSIESLEPIRGLPELWYLALLGDTTILDGDLSPIESLEKLSVLKLSQRRHYNRTRGGLLGE